MNRLMIFAMSVLVIGASALGVSIVLAPSASATTGIVRTYAACVYEDGSGGPTPCIWDGKTRGNGQGVSYRVIQNVPGEYISKTLSDRRCTVAEEWSQEGPCRVGNGVWNLADGTQVRVAGMVKVK